MLKILRAVIMSKENCVSMRMKTSNIEYEFPCHVNMTLAKYKVARKQM